MPRPSITAVIFSRNTGTIVLTFAWSSTPSPAREAVGASISRCDLDVTFRTAFFRCLCFSKLPNCDGGLFFAFQKTTTVTGRTRRDKHQVQAQGTKYKHFRSFKYDLRTKVRMPKQIGGRTFLGTQRSTPSGHLQALRITTL